MRVSALSPGLLVLALSAAPAAQGFETLANAWRSGIAHFRINPNFPSPALSGAPDQQLEILRAAAAAWRDQSSANFEFIYDGTTTRVGVNLTDGINAVSFLDDDGGDALAATFIRSDQRDRVAAFDIVFYASSNSSPINWNGPRDPASGTMDLGGVAVHEFGHALGLDHTPIAQATMFASATGRGLQLRTLHADDLAGVHFLYGSGRPGADSNPAILGLTPDFGPAAGGNEVLVRGRNFTWTADSTVRIAGAPLLRSQFQVESLGLLRILAMPSHAGGPASLTVANELGVDEVAGAYRYGAPVPQLFAIVPSSGPLGGGIDVTLQGANFTAEARVLIGGQPLVSPRLLDSQTIAGILPSATVAGVVSVRLLQGAEAVDLPGAFTYSAKVLELGEASLYPGESGVPIDLRATTDVALGAISLGLVFEPSNLSIEAIQNDGTVTVGAAFAAAKIDNDAGTATYGVVMDFFDSDPSIPARANQLVARVVAASDPEATVGTETPLHLETNVGDPPIELFFTPAGTVDKIRPFTVDGLVRIVPGPLFIRGEVSGDGRVDMADAVRLLDALFRGGAAIDCDDAADANDDGFVNVSDPVYLLLFLFSGGESIPLPFPEPGIDASDDALRC
jgi:hypothetical protein